MQYASIVPTLAIFLAKNVTLIGNILLWRNLSPANAPECIPLPAFQTFGLSCGPHYSNVCLRHVSRQRVREWSETSSAFIQLQRGSVMIHSFLCLVPYCRINSFYRPERMMTRGVSYTPLQPMVRPDEAYLYFQCRFSKRSSLQKKEKFLELHTYLFYLYCTIYILRSFVLSALFAEGQFEFLAMSFLLLQIPASRVVQLTKRVGICRHARFTRALDASLE